MLTSHIPNENERRRSKRKKEKRKRESSFETRNKKF